MRFYAIIKTSAQFDVNNVNNNFNIKKLTKMTPLVNLL